MPIHYITMSVLVEGKISCPSSSDLYDELFHTLWFLKSLFICYLLYLFFRYCRNKSLSIAFAIILVVAIPFLGFFHLKLMFPSFMAGVVLKKTNLLALRGRMLLYVSGIVFFLCLTCWSADYFVSPTKIVSNLIAGNMKPISTFLYRYLYAVLIGISGGLFFISLFYESFKNSQSPSMTRVSEAGRYTLGIYILQTIILETILGFYISFDYGFVSNSLLISLISICILFICLYITSWLMHFKSISKLLLGS